MTGADEQTVEWLLGGDPAIRWQTERDLLGEPADRYEATRSLIGEEGWGRRLLDLQDPEGTWGGGLYQPKWTSTTYTLLLLKDMGLLPGHPGALAGCERLLGGVWLDGGLTYWPRSGRPPELCVNSMVLAVSAYFGVEASRIGSIAEHLIGAVMTDGAWNCLNWKGAAHSSFHTTISALEALGEWRRATGSKRADDAISSAHEFMLAHRMYRSHRTGEVIDDAWTAFRFPPRWHYDVLRGLDHLRASGTLPDERVSEAIELVRRRRRSDGRWPKGSQYSGETHFAMEPGRAPGRWNTLRALRVLKWWEASRPLSPTGAA